MKYIAILAAMVVASASWGQKFLGTEQLDTLTFPDGSYLTATAGWYADDGSGHLITLSYVSGLTDPAGPFIHTDTIEIRGVLYPDANGQYDPPSLILPELQLMEDIKYSWARNLFTVSYTTEQFFVDSWPLNEPCWGDFVPDDNGLVSIFQTNPGIGDDFVFAPDAGLGAFWGVCRNGEFHYAMDNILALDATLCLFGFKRPYWEIDRISYWEEWGVLNVDGDMLWPDHPNWKYYWDIYNGPDWPTTFEPRRRDETPQHIWPLPDPAVVPGGNAPMPPYDYDPSPYQFPPFFQLPPPLLDPNADPNDYLVWDPDQCEYRLPAMSLWEWANGWGTCPPLIPESQMPPWCLTYPQIPLDGSWPPPPGMGPNP